MLGHKTERVDAERRIYSFVLGLVWVAIADYNLIQANLCGESKGIISSELPLA